MINFPSPAMSAVSCQAMPSADLVSVAIISNDTSRDMRLHLEATGDEVVLSPGHKIELLAQSSDEIYPLAINYFDGGMQIYANLDPDPDWHIKFNGRVYSAGRPAATRTADLEAETSSESDSI